MYWHIITEHSGVRLDVFLTPLKLNKELVQNSLETFLIGRISRYKISRATNLLYFCAV